MTTANCDRMPYPAIYPLTDLSTSLVILPDDSVKLSNLQCGSVYRATAYQLRAVKYEGTLTNSFKSSNHGREPDARTDRAHVPVYMRCEKLLIDYVT